MGHAGALISGGADTADAKLAIMEECGFTVTRNPLRDGASCSRACSEPPPALKSPRDADRWPRLRPNPQAGYQPSWRH